MKTRDSGMPGEDSWSTFFDVDAILRGLGVGQDAGRVIDVGCGYGTFTMPIARLAGNEVVAIDIEEDLVRALAGRARAEGLARVSAVIRDVAACGLGEPDGSADAVLLFNLLHCEDPGSLLGEAHRVLRVGGRVAVIHWRSDVPTPRGPDLAIRPRPEAIGRWLAEAGFEELVPATVLPPYHFGMVGAKRGG